MRRFAAEGRAALATTRRRSIVTMAISSTRKAAPKRKSPARTSPGPSDSPSRPFLRFYHSDALRKRTLSVLAAVEKAGDAADHREELADLVVELTKCGLEAYFMEPLKASGAGFIVQQSASLGLAGSMQVMGSAIRSIVGRMDAPQVLSVSRSIRGFMR